MENKIHAIWLGPRMTPLSFACVDDWQKQGYDFTLWTEQDPIIHELIDGCHFAKECYKRKLYAFVTDYLRLKLLQLYGGLYLDTDVTIQKNPFPLFNGADFSVGYENEQFLGSAIIYAKKTSIVLASLINFYENDIWQSKLFIGPQILTLILRKHENQEKVICYPIEYFYSYQGEAFTFNKGENSYLIHWFQHSWKETSGIIFLKVKSLPLFERFYVYQKYSTKVLLSPFKKLFKS